MKLLINLIRNLLGGIIAAVDFVTRGSKLKRTADAQKQVEAELQNLSLFQFFACPFCIKTRRAMYKMNLPIVKRNASQGSPFRDELLQGGGKVQTPFGWFFVSLGLAFISDLETNLKPCFSAISIAWSSVT